MKKWFIKTGLVFALLLMVLIALAWKGPTTPIATAGDQTQSSIINVSGTGKISVDPDRARFTVGVNSSAKTARLAQQENSKQVSEIINALVAQGVNKKDIQTQNFNIYPDYAQSKDGRQGQVVGFRVNMDVTVNVKNITKTGSYLDAALAAGANQANGISFYKEETPALKQQLLNKAYQDAKLKGLALAEAAGVKIAGVTTIQEGSISTPFNNQNEYRNMKVMESNSIPVEPGQIELSTNIQVVYRIN